ncbi:FAD-dependent oxidoreductase [Bacteroides eggerthii]|uniref:Pyridine nucleotide-disulfide oxidoreductase RclA n=1 Tax=Bacteroides eggerthii TaxID=28111 RepID=A0A975Q536_9BACE|nr:FAD-dependent oxidoreductase [Bacteroides eggerthii]QUT44152.1 putative pyridine nucleotide-disulfide oxidoreductase RclA [Bacteroides eggerthii]
MKQYDAIIIGFGKGGKLLAAELANRNWKVAIIERSSQMYGGTCVNAGCIPTKTLIHESEQAEWLYRDNYDSQAKFYTSAVSRKNKLVSFLRDKNHEHLKSYPNITLYDGGASFMSNDTVKVAHDKKEILLQGKEIFINTGSTPILPDVEGLNESKHAFTSETLLRQSVLPKHLLILGAGTIGMEFATMYAGFGSRVTLLESGNRFMPKSDRDIAESMLEALKRKGIEVRLNVHALSMYDTANGMTLTYTDNSDGTPYFLEGDALLLATGRRAMTDGQGAIVVNGHLQTTSPHIWAMGDVRGGSMYDYLSIDDFRIITNHLFGNKKRNMDDRLPVPYVIFTDPPLAHIGTTEEEAVKRGYSIQVSRLPAAAIPRARTLQHIDGMLKVIVNAHTGRIMGCTLFCVDAPEVINLVALAMKNDLHYSVLRDFIFTHPSMSEGLNDLFKAF